MTAEDRYRAPSAQERTAAAAAFEQLLDHPGRPAATAGFTPLGFAPGSGTDPDTGRRWAAVASTTASGTGWGVVVVDLSAPVRVAIEVPHPRSDIDSDTLGLELFRRLPGAVMIMAGAHRRAAGGTADVAHEPDSLFNAFATVLADRGLPQAQLHGFADENLAGTDIAVSTGTDTGSALAERVATASATRGLAVCRAWQESCGRLEGTTNVEAKGAELSQSAFLHIEASATVRTTAAGRTRLVAALADSRLADP
jgi:hypothetical protein